MFTAFLESIINIENISFAYKPQKYYEGEGKTKMKVHVKWDHCALTS